MNLDNFKIRSKLVMIYIICVLLPLIVTNFLFMYTVTQNVRQEESDNMEDVRSRVTYELNMRINNVIAISDYLYMNEKLNEFTEKNYTSPAEYYEYFNEFMEDSVIRYYYTTESVYNVQICTDNETIISGSYFKQKKEVEDYEWYHMYQQKAGQTFIIAYYEENNAYEQSMNQARHVSLVRKMDYFGQDTVMKIDFDYGSLAGIFEHETAETDIYVSDGEKIIFSSDSLQNGKEDYLPLSDYKKREVEVTGTMDVLGSTWEIYVTKDSYGIAEALKGQKENIVILFLINLILPSILIIIVDKSFKKRIFLTERYIKKAEQGEFEEIPGDPGRDEIGNLIRSFNLMTLKIKELIEVVYKKDAERKSMAIARNRAELDALKRQINPHFMYNTLETIRMHSLVKKEKETADMMGQFAVLLRRVTHWENDFVEVREEAQSVQFYLDIQKARFGKRLEYSVYVQKEAEALKIPKFSILTFVENSCIHGIEPKVGGGSITVSLTSDEELIYVEVIDSGQGMENETLEQLRTQIRNASIEELSTSKSIGILNTVVRMKLYFGERVEFEIESTQNEGTELYIKIPKLKEEEYSYDKSIVGG